MSPVDHHAAARALDRVRAVPAARAALDDEEKAAVAAARTAGVTMQAIADALGITHRALYKRVNAR
jgi:transposase-like protein